MRNQKTLLRALPKVDECISQLESELDGSIPHRIVKECVQKVIDEERKKILSNDISVTEKSSQEWSQLFQRSIVEKMNFNFRRIINGTGVVVHTNLGRSLLPPDATSLLTQAGAFYSNLEFDLHTGKRGSRYSLVEELICELTGAEAALVVNNNAAAVLLALDTFSKDTEVIVSRGQLVEIGGSFRIPDVMAKSGATLVEVGATNRTHLKDYKSGITEDTSMLLKVHTSNFKVIGFTSEVASEDLVALAHEHDLITMEDLGSGSLIDLSSYGLEKEPTVQESVEAGIDIVTFSGDKLLGGPQAGIIVGKENIIEKIKKNPLNRALRIDKFTLASLEAIMRCYYDEQNALQTVPTLNMLTVDADTLKKRARKIAARLRKIIRNHCKVTIAPTLSRVGGGAMPDCALESWAVELVPEQMSLSKLERELRKISLPVIGRLEHERFVIDVRTVQEVEIKDLCNSLSSVLIGAEQV